MRRLLLSTALILASLLTAVLLMEIALRLLGLGWPLFTQVDPWTGFALRPGAEGEATDEGRAYVKINSAGMRDIEHLKAKPLNTIRIAILGDSYAEARQVELDQTFWSVMGDQLKQCPGRNGKTVEVLNFGVSGFGTAQELLQLRSKVWDYQPDIVLLAFTTGNDVRNNSFALEKNPDKPYMNLQEGNLTPDFSFRDRPLFKNQTSALSQFEQKMLMSSRVLQLLYHSRTLFTHAPAISPSPSKIAISGTETGLDTAVYFDHPEWQDWRNAWAITDAMLIQMHKEVQAHGAQFLVVSLSSGIQVNPDPAVRAAFAKQLGVHDLFAPERHLSQTGARDGFAVLALARSLARYAERNHVFLHGFANATIGEGHWNAEGHRVAGVEMAKELCVGRYLQ